MRQRVFENGAVGCKRGCWVASKVQTRLQRSEARSDAILKASLDAIIGMDHTGRIVEFNPAAERMFGLSRAEAVGELLGDLLVPERLRTAHRQGLERYLATGVGTVVNRRVELPALRADGVEFPVELAIIPVVDADPPLFIGFLRDLTERRRGDEQRELLIGELNHRVKNTLAIVQGIAAQSFDANASVESAQAAFVARLTALSDAHDLLTRSNWEGTDLESVARAALEPHADDAVRRLRFDGPFVRLAPSAALSFTLTLHELATNATKYGALSAEGGRIDLVWRLTGEEGARRLNVRWAESGGPPVTQPERKGFGSRLIERALAHNLDAQIEITFPPTGVVCEIDARMPPKQGAKPGGP